MWLLSPDVPENLFPQTWHSFGFSPVWLLKCLTSSELNLHLYSHSWHLRFFFLYFFTTARAKLPLLDSFLSVCGLGMEYIFPDGIWMMALSRVALYLSTTFKFASVLFLFIMLWSVALKFLWFELDSLFTLSLSCTLFMSLFLSLRISGSPLPYWLVIKSSFKSSSLCSMFISSASLVFSCPVSISCLMARNTLYSIVSVISETFPTGSKILGFGPGFPKFPFLGLGCLKDVVPLSNVILP